ncbi:MAG TPA: hypothetical protein VFE45_09205 [Coriobacteriia bacterium]|nr:hypothetical protein [Coriobacteriia bacterium]
MARKRYTITQASLVRLAQEQSTTTLIDTAIDLDGKAHLNEVETFILHTIFSVVEARHDLGDLITEIAGAEGYDGTYTTALVEALLGPLEATDLEAAQLQAA